MKTKMRHLIILLPGIMGSVLQKNGKDVWALSGQALWQYLRTLGDSLEQLRIVEDDWQRNDLGDGIRAVRLIEDIHSIPFLVEHAGYAVMVRRIKEYFDVTEGSIHEPQDDQNFFTFPYDWRRDNRASARNLRRFIEKQLPAWRKQSGADNAQVILIGHSMGGLISRYYLEVLGGWRSCLVLITVGSPHRGAVKALNLLSNGLVFSNLSDLVRSFRSAYQILPTYPVVEIDGNYVRAAETSAIPNVNQQLAKVTRAEFLDAIRQAAIANRKEPSYHQRTIPWIGTRQDTLQTARLIQGKLIVGYNPPAGIDAELADGDGTVPRVSALPEDLDGEQYERFAVERHGWLTNNDMTLEPLLDTLKQIMSPGAKGIYRYAHTKPTFSSVNMRLESLFLPNESVTMYVKLVSDSSQPQSLRIGVDPVGVGEGTIKTVEAKHDETTAVKFGVMPPGLYQITVGPNLPEQQALATTHGVFEVVGPEVLNNT